MKMWSSFVSTMCISVYNSFALVIVLQLCLIVVGVPHICGGIQEKSRPDMDNEAHR